jgi:hypothetical protein
MKIINILKVWGFVLCVFFVFQNNCAFANQSDAQVERISKEEAKELLDKKTQAFSKHDIALLSSLFWDDAAIERVANKEEFSWTLEKYIAWQKNLWSSCKESTVTCQLKRCTLIENTAQCVFIIREKIVFLEGTVIFTATLYEDIFEKRNGIIKISHSYLNDDYSVNESAPVSADSFVDTIKQKYNTTNSDAGLELVD